MTENGTELTKEIFEEQSQDTLDIGGIAFFNWIAEAGLTLPPWWSRQRDEELRRFWKASDPLAGAINTLGEMLSSIPFKIVPRDATIKAHIKSAQEFEFNLNSLTESRSNLSDKGWISGFSPFLQDHWTQDNGGWFVIEGEGIKIPNPWGEMTDGPLKPGSSRRLIHLDSSRCWRTKYKEWPVWYTDFDGRMYFIHHTRLINLTSMPSPIMEMKGVGFCAVSRCPGIAQNMADIIRYKQEKLGSRPKRGMLVVEGGGAREVKSIESQLALADEAIDNLGLARYAPLPVIGIKNGGTVSLLDLNSIPDGFDELTSTQLNMSFLALAFAVDTRTLSFAIGVSGQTKADAEIQHLKTRGKGPGAIIRRITQQIESKFLPPYLKIVFDFQDDEQDKLNADIRKVRSERREKDLTAGTTDIRTERQQMVANGELTEAQFVELELQSGRLENGEDILILLQSQDQEFQQLLPVNQFSMPDEIELAIENVQSIIINTASSGVKSKAKIALRVLEKLIEMQSEMDGEEEVTDDDAKFLLKQIKSLEKKLAQRERPVQIVMPERNGEWQTDTLKQLPAPQPAINVTVEQPEMELVVDRDPQTGLIKSIKKVSK